MTWRIGLVLAAMAIALTGQCVAIILVSPHDQRTSTPGAMRSRSHRQLPPPSAAQGDIQIGARPAGTPPTVGKNRGDWSKLGPRAA
jgi:hypothetical protein